MMKSSRHHTFARRMKIPVATLVALLLASVANAQEPYKGSAISSGGTRVSKSIGPASGRFIAESAADYGHNIDASFSHIMARSSGSLYAKFKNTSSYPYDYYTFAETYQNPGTAARTHARLYVNGTNVVGLTDRLRISRAYLTPSLGNRKFFEVETSIPLGFFAVTLTLDVRGSASFVLDSQASAPFGDTPRDTVASRAAISAAIVAEGSVTVLGVGPYGKVTLVSGSFGPAAAAERVVRIAYARTAQYHINSSGDFSVSSLGGEAGVKAGSLKASFVDWGSPFRWSGSLYSKKKSSGIFFASF